MKIIEITEATKQYKESVVLNNVSLSFDEGLIHGIIGRNGSGKTVLFKAICGFVRLTTGTIKVQGKLIGKDIDMPSDIGIIIETPGFLPNYSAIGNLMLLAKIRNRVTKKEISGVIEKVGLDPDSRKHVGKFSMGMKQRLGIAQAIMENPSLLVLDEPFNGLDIAGVQDMRKLLLELKSQGKTILIASHSAEDIQFLCDTVHRMDQGELLSTI